MSEQQTIVALGGVSELSRLDCVKGANSILLVTGKSSFKSSGAKLVVESALCSKKLVHYSDFSPNPEFEEALRGGEICRDAGIDLIIAIGGGSVIDMAKLVNVLQANPGSELAVCRGRGNCAELLPMVALPTTAGTGSEATHFAVVYVDGKKYSVADSHLLPEVTILDAELTYNLSPFQTACTGLDALCQAIESLWAKAATRKSSQYARLALEMLIPNLAQSVQSPNHKNREAMLLGANYAGRAINISKTTAPHALSYRLAQLLQIPHGYAVALTLGRFLSHHQKLIDSKKVPDSLASIFQDIYSVFGVDDGYDAEIHWKELIEQCGLKYSLHELGVNSSKMVDDLVASVNVERLGNHPVEISESDLYHILTQ